MTGTSWTVALALCGMTACAVAGVTYAMFHARTSATAAIDVDGGSLEPKATAIVEHAPTGPEVHAIDAAHAPDLCGRLRRRS